MATEKRAYQRIPIHWEAQVEGDGRPPQRFTITDFCEGGLFLAPASDDVRATLQAHESAGADASVQVRFFDPETRGFRKVPVRVVRHSGHGLGVAFQDRHHEAFNALNGIVRHQRMQAPKEQAAELHHVDPARAREIVRDAKPLIADFLNTRFRSFAGHADTKLFEWARLSESDAEQYAYLAAASGVRDNYENLSSEFSRASLGRFRAMLEGRQSEHARRDFATPESAQLSLVNDTEFEDWLIRSEQISRSETRDARQLHLLEQRFSALFSTTVDRETNMLSPAAFCNAFSDALENLTLEPMARHALYRVFGQAFMAHLGELYQSLNDFLADQGVLPELETEGHRVRNPERVPRSQPANEQPAKPAEPERKAPTEDTTASEQPPPSEPSQPAKPTTTGDLATAVQSLHELRRQLRANDSPAPGASTGSAGDAGPTFQTQEVLGALTSVQSDLAAQAPTLDQEPGLRARVLDALGDSDSEKALSDEHLGQVELLDEWFSDVQQDVLNTDFLREWSGKLSVLALRVQLGNGGFLKEQSHPIHQLLNQLDKAGIALATQQGDAKERLQKDVERILADVLADRDAQPEAMEEAAKALEKTVQAPLRTHSINLQKMLQECEGKQRLERAKKRAASAMSERLAGEPVPRPIVELVQGAWQNVLVLIQLREGPESQDWKRALKVIETLLRSLGTASIKPEPVSDAKDALTFIESQLDAFSRNSTKMVNVLKELDYYIQAVRRDGSGERPEMIDFPAEEGPDLAAQLEGIDQRWIGMAKLLNIGDWVFFSGRDGTPEPLRLSWVSEDRGHFVFSRRNGKKGSELSLPELAKHLQAAAAGLAEDMDMPLTDRQWQRRLNEMNDELLHQATHDPLTGALNRHTYQKRLRSVLERPHAKEHRGVIVHFSLDGFKVVNSTLDYEAGDELLKQLTQLLSEDLNENDLLGRAGGDEFTVYLDHRSIDQGRNYAEQKRREFNERGFRWNGDALSVSVSVGVVPFMGNEYEPGQLIKDADEASLAAKNAGGNRLHMVTPDDSELQTLRTSMERAASLDSALNTGTLQLRCQRIEPIGAALNAMPMYEILIGMQGSTNELVPPGQFIPAAERFGRMAAVDRWVLQTLCEWVSNQSHRIRYLDALTVNLSAQTLTDPGFPDFVETQFLRNDIEGRKICFEVTETAAVANLATAADMIRDLKGLGCRFALDDFGSGLASYAYLKNLPVDFLKIDGELVRGIVEHKTDQAVVKSINELSHYLGKSTIGEYVESEAILNCLRQLGLDYAQGYFVERPIPIDELNLGH